MGYIGMWVKQGRCAICGVAPDDIILPTAMSTMVAPPTWFSILEFLWHNFFFYLCSQWLVLVLNYGCTGAMLEPFLSKCHDILDNGLNCQWGGQQVGISRVHSRFYFSCKVWSKGSRGNISCVNRADRLIYEMYLYNINHHLSLINCDGILNVMLYLRRPSIIITGFI